MTNDEKIADLQREIEALKRAMSPTADDRAAMDRRVAEHRDQMHQMAEARMARAGNFSREDLAAMEAAAPRSVCQDIAARGGVRPPSADGTTGTISAVHPSPGLPGTTNGWREAVPSGPMPGVALADRLMDEADRRDRVELVERLAKTHRVEAAARKLAEEKP
jgi:hypothetical protein